MNMDSLEKEKEKYYSEKIVKTLLYITRCENLKPEEMEQREKLSLVMRVIAEKQKPTLITQIIMK